MKFCCREYNADSEGNIKVKPRKMPQKPSSTDEISSTSTALPVKKPILDSIEKLTGSSSVGSPRPQPKAILSPDRPTPLKLDEQTDELKSAANSFGEVQVTKSQSQNLSEASTTINGQEPSSTSPINDSANEPRTPVRPPLTLKESLASLHSKEHVNTVPVPTTPTSPNTPREDLSTQRPAPIDSINSSTIEAQHKAGSVGENPSTKKDDITTGSSGSIENNFSSDNVAGEAVVKRVKLYPNGDRYEGEFNSKGVRHGKGVYTTNDGNVYVGEYKDGTRHGKGTYTMHNGSR